MPAGESVKKTSVTREPGYLYYLAGAQLKLMRKRSGRGSTAAAQKVMDVGVSRQSGWLYFASGSTGQKIEIRRSRMKRR
jgi:hypothetical protein